MNEENNASKPIRDENIPAKKPNKSLWNQNQMEIYTF